MKILWHSNAPYAPTGYGNQTGLFATLLTRAGHEVVISAFYGLRGASLNINGIKILPGINEMWGNDVLERHFKEQKADLIWTLIDAWVIQTERMKHLPLAMWAPVDHDPVPPPVVDKLQHARWAVAYSRHGERQYRQAGLDPFYVPHAIDCGVFFPDDRVKARERWSFPEDAFVAVCVAANKGYPSRKLLDRLIKAWARFAQGKKALLFLHTMTGPEFQGLNLPEIVQFYGCEDSVAFPDPARFAAGEYGAKALRDLYSAADIFVLPSMGEGFCIPLLEAQACGCPVITTDFTAQSEIVFSGWKIPVEWYDRVWTYQNSEQCAVRPSQIVEALEWAYSARGVPELREAAREGAMLYDGQSVMDRFMLPTLAVLEQEVRDASPVPQ